MLRYDSPVQVTVRMPLRDTEVAGVPIKREEAMLLMLGGANRDPAVFENPDVFDVRRENANAHLAFSSGIHFCLGASLARMEASVGLQALYDRFPDLTPAGRRPDAARGCCAATSTCRCVGAERRVALTGER